MNGSGDEILIDSIDNLLVLLPPFEKGEFAAADAHYRQTGKYLPQVILLCEKVSESGLVRSFDWMSWKKAEAPTVLSKEGIARADLLTLRKILTYCVEQDRFFAGFSTDGLFEWPNAGRITAFAAGAKTSLKRSIGWSKQEQVIGLSFSKSREEYERGSRNSGVQGNGENYENYWMLGPNHFSFAFHFLCTR